MLLRAACAGFSRVLQGCLLVGFTQALNGWAGLAGGVAVSLVGVPVQWLASGDLAGVVEWKGMHGSGLLDWNEVAQGRVSAVAIWRLTSKASYTSVENVSLR